MFELYSMQPSFKILYTVLQYLFTFLGISNSFGVVWTNFKNNLSNRRWYVIINKAFGEKIANFLAG